MAALKNQHFVPKCLFKHFSLNREAKAIHLLHLASNRLVPNASVSGQCSGDYLYGKHAVVEQGLSGFEGLFGSALSRVVTGGNQAADLHTIRFFAYLQMRRTQTAAERIQAGLAMIQKGIFGDGPQPALPAQREMLLESLSICIKTRKDIEDLKVRIIDNRTPINFVLSDDPAVFTNRYVFQRLKQSSFGLISTGVILLMPLTPRLAVVCYDPNAYYADLDGNRIHLRNTDDVEAINELQYVKAAGNVYFSNWDSGAYVQSQFERYHERRRDSWVEVGFLKHVGETNRGDRYRTATAQEMRQGEEPGLASLTFRYPEPSRWPPFLRLRPKVKSFSNGSIVGEVRKSEWLRS